MTAALVSVACLFVICAGGIWAAGAALNWLERMIEETRGD